MAAEARSSRELDFGEITCCCDGLDSAGQWLQIEGG